MTHPRLFTAVIAGSLILAACGGGAAPASSPAAPSSPAPASAAAKPSAAAALASTSAKPAASAAASAAAGAALKLGVLLPFTGPLSVAGKDNQDSISLYLEQTGGSLAGRKVELVNADDAADGQVG